MFNQCPPAKHGHNRHDPPAPQNSLLQWGRYRLKCYIEIIDGSLQAHLKSSQQIGKHKPKVFTNKLQCSNQSKL